MKNCNLVVVIVDRYKEEQVLNKALTSGAISGVIINGRGTADQETLNILGINIQPEKRVVLLVVSDAKTKVVLDELNSDLSLDEVNKGIAFTLPVKQAIGLEELL